MSALALLLLSAITIPDDTTLRTRMAAGARPSPAPARLAAGSADSIVVEKAARRLTLYVDGAAVRTYRVALGENPVGAKRARGDKKTPEGLYVIDRRNAHSKYYRSLRISYPNAIDRFLAAEQGLEAGGDVMLHGLPPEAKAMGVYDTHWQDNWTQGCVALTNEQIDELWHAVADGTRIRILP